MITTIQINQSIRKIYKNHIKWLNKKIEENSLKLEFFPNIQILDDVVMKEKIKIQISNNFITTLYKTGYDDLTEFRINYFRLLGSNQYHKVIEGDNIELRQALCGGRDLKKYDYNFKINKGILDNQESLSYISIPTQKLGIQEFTITLNMKNWETEKDTTLYLTQTFEVIE